MKTLNIDIETYSDIDIKYGVYRYTDTPHFEVLIFAYSVDGGEVTEIDLTQEALPKEIVEALTDDTVLKVAYNAQFERVCLSKHLGLDNFLDPRQWHCTMIHAMQLGLPASLRQCAIYLDVEEQKDTAGTQLINYFSKPCKPTKANGKRTRNLPEHDPGKWEDFQHYCGQDVRTEMAIADKLSPYPVPESEWELYVLDQEMNDRGVEVDVNFAKNAVAIDDTLRSHYEEDLKAVTQLDNPNSVKQLKEWLEEQGYYFESLGKALIEERLASGEIQGKAKEALELRLKLANSSTKKYIMLEEATCSDNRIRGIIQFYGASRTGRYAGRLIQVQNLPRNYIQTLEEARYFVNNQDIQALDLIYGDVPDILKQLIRTGLIAKEGHVLHVSDYSAIEARVIAWYAQEEWVLEAFRTHGKIYEATADRMFNLGGVDNVSRDMRQRGKVATLALGYQGSIGALKAMGALQMGIPEEELQGLVDQWRKSNPNIVNFWYQTQKNVQYVLRKGGVVKGQRGLKFFQKGNYLFIKLPSGRRLSYPNARLEDSAYGPKIVFDGLGQRVGTTPEDTYGGKLVENIVQATARDVLAEGLKRLDQEGYQVVFHVHDEVVAEVPEGTRTIEDMNTLLSITPEWAEGLPLGAEGFETKHYMKD